MNINYEYYKIFYYVAKYKNMTKAAIILNNNQPNISRTIKLLENELGCQLLIRSNRGIHLTPEGEKLYSYVKAAVEQIQNGEDKIMKATHMEKGNITIGVSETALHMILPVLSLFKKKYPDIRIRIINHLTTQAIDSLKNRTVDFSIVASPINIDKTLISYSITQFHDILIGGPAYHFNDILSLKDITSFPLICLREDTMTYQFYDHFYQQYNLNLKPELEAATTDQILPMIKNGLGIGFIPEIYVKEAMKNKEVYEIKIKESIPKREIYFIENEIYPLSIAAKEFKNMLIEYFQQEEYTYENNE